MEENLVDSNVILFEILNAIFYHIGKLSAEESYSKLNQNRMSQAIETWMIR